MINKNLKTKQNTNNFLFLTSNRGITLIALIVTIIIMIILVGVTVNIALKGGLFITAKEAVKQTQIQAYQEELDLIRPNVEIKRYVQGLTSKEYMDSYQEEIKNDNLFKDSTVTRKDDNTIVVVTPEGYVFEVTEEETKYLGEQNKSDTPPTLTESDTKILYDPSGWTNGEVTVSIETEKEGYTLQYSTDGHEWKEYTDPFKVEDNGVVIYARLINNRYQVGGVLTGTVLNIDRLKPISVSIENIETTTSSITVTASAEDADATDTNGKSNIAKYYFSKDDGATWEPNEGQKETEYTFEGLTQGENYNIKVKAEDGAKNQTEINEAQIVTTEKIPGGNDSITFGYSETEWTNQNVNVTISSTAGNDYTLQYSKDGSTWEDYTSEVEMSQNGSIYAKLVDSKGQEGATATGNVKNIDKERPTVSASLQSTSITSSSITLSTDVTDNSSGISKIIWYYKLSTETEYKNEIDTYELTNGTGETAKVTKTHEFTGLTAKKTYNTYAEVYDVAGNTTRTPISESLDIKLPQETDPVEKLKAGEYVNYVDRNGKKILCIVLYDTAYNTDNGTNYGIQLMTYYNVETVELGNGTGESRSKSSESYMEVAIKSYNDAIKILNDRAQLYLNTTYACQARCVGSLPNSPYTDTTEYFVSDKPWFPTKYKNVLKDVDNNYLEDCNQLRSLGKTCFSPGGSSYWMASRYCQDNYNGTTQRLGIRIADDSNYYGGSCIPNSDEELLYFQSDMAESWSQRYGLRLCFTLNPGLKLIGGSGTSTDPYELGV